MPLSILLPLVIGGIAAIAILLHVSGRSRRVMLSPQDAMSAWRRHFPEDDPVEVSIAADGHAALVLTRQGTGLIWAMGADTAARRLTDFDLIEDADGLTVHFHDFAAPRARIKLDDTQRRRWITLMDPT